MYPRFSRRMLRALLAAGAKATELVEVPEKEHWWWDTKRSNDGGCVNDGKMRGFFSQCLRRAVGAQRHMNGVVSNNNKYNNFGFGGIKRPF